MTPKFDNLASLLMEMPRGGKRKVDYDEVAMYIKEFPEAKFKEIAAAFGVTPETIANIAKKLDVQRGRGGLRHGEHLGLLNKDLKGKETHQGRKLTDVQEKQILDYWMANHHEMTLPELARWVKQQFNIVTTKTSMQHVLKRAAAKHNVRLPPPDKGKGHRLMKQRSQHRNEPGSGKLPTQGSHYLKDTEPGIVPSNPKHGGPAHPPK